MLESTTGRYNHEGIYRILRTQVPAVALKPTLKVSSSESLDPEEASRSPLPRPVSSPLTEDPLLIASPAQAAYVEAGEPQGLRIKF